MRLGKRIISCFLSVTIAVSMMCGLFVFEASATYGDDWEVGSYSQNTTTFSTDTKTVYDSSPYSLKIENKDYDISYFKKTVTVKPNTCYCFSVYVKYEGYELKPGENTYGGALLRITSDPFDISMTADSARTLSDSWTKLTVHYVTKEDQTSLIIRLYNSPYSYCKGTAYFSAISFFSETEWEGPNSTKASFSLDTETVYNNEKYSLKLENTDYTTSSIKKTVTVKPNTDYLFSVYVKYVGYELKPGIEKESGVRLQISPDPFVASLSSVSVSTHSDDWTKLSIRYHTKEDQTSLVLTMCNGVYNYSCKGTAYFGAVSFFSETEWELSYNYTDAICSTDTETVYNNEPYSLKIENTDYATRSIKKTVAVKPNTTYRFTACVKYSGYELKPGAERDSGAVLKMYSDSSSAESTTTHTDEWSKLTATYHTKQNENTLELYLYNTCKGTAWFGNVRLEEATETTNQWNILTIFFTKANGSCTLQQKGETVTIDSSYSDDLIDYYKENLDLLYDELYALSGGLMDVRNIDYKVSELTMSAFVANVHTMNGEERDNVFHNWNDPEFVNEITRLMGDNIYQQIIIIEPYSEYFDWGGLSGSYLGIRKCEVKVGMEASMERDSHKIHYFFHEIGHGLEYDTKDLGLDAISMDEEFNRDYTKYPDNYDWYKAFYQNKVEGKISVAPRAYYRISGYSLVTDDMTPGDGVAITGTLPTIRSIKLGTGDKAPKTNYQLNEDLDLKVGKIIVNYDNGRKKEIGLNSAGVTVTGYDKTKTGNQTITVKYEGFTTSFEVNVKAVSVTGITVTAPTKTTYFVGEELDLTGGKVTISYNIGEPKTVDLTPSMVIGYDKTKLGNQTVTVKYEGFTDTFEVTVISPSPVVANGKNYDTLSAALAANKTGALNITIYQNLTETKAITIPKTNTSAILTTAPGVTLTLTNTTITANCDLTIDAAIEPSNIAKALTIKIAAEEKVTINRLESPLPLTLSGTKTSDVIIDTDAVIASAATVNIEIKAGNTVKLTKGTFKPTALTGSGTLDIYDASTVTVGSIKDSSIILNQYSGKNNTVMLPKLTVGEFDNVSLTVKTPKGEKADIAGKSIFTLSKASTAGNIAGVKITNKAGSNTLNAVPYKKDVRAEWTGALTMTCNGTPTDYSSFEKAIEAITANAKKLPTADYVLTMNESAEVTKLALPAKAGSLTINGNGNTLKLIGVTSIAPKYAFALKNISIIAQAKNGNANALTITDTSTGNVEIDGLAFTGKTLTIKGGAKNNLTLGECSAINSLTGFSTTTINAPVEIQKTLTATNLTLGAEADIKINKGATLTVNKVLTGSDGAKITLDDGFKPIVLKGAKLDDTIKGSKIKLISGDSTKFDEKQIFTSKLDLYQKFDVSGIASDAACDLALQSGKVYLKPFVIEMEGKKYAYWSDVIKVVNSRKYAKGTTPEECAITLLADHNIGAALTLPAKGKYSKLTINGNGHKLTFVGSSVSLTGETTLENITIASVNKKTGADVKWTLNKNKNTLNKDESVTLLNCNEK